jgi:cell fate regulator YaaT (PSP1 superfamily)
MSELEAPLAELIELQPRQRAADDIAHISFLKIGKYYPFDLRDYPHLEIGDYVVVSTNTLGEQIGQVKRFLPRSDMRESTYLHRISRPATPADLLLRQQWEQRDVAALIECREMAAQFHHYRRVKFVAAEYNYLGNLLMIFFSTEEESAKINLNPLRQNLQKALEARIEFRQIGPREVAKLQGGFGACGIPRCCSTFLTDFSPISITMAKAQGISLSTQELTGMCGRLRCCLRYEYEQYVEARKLLPKLRKRVGTPQGEGRVIDIHPMEDAVTVLVDEERLYLKREELIPLSELEALRQAAGQPCSKNEGGGCDCGAKRPRGTAEELLDEMGLPEVALSGFAEGDEEDYGGPASLPLSLLADSADDEDDYQDEIIDPSQSESRYMGDVSSIHIGGRPQNTGDRRRGDQKNRQGGQGQKGRANTPQGPKSQGNQGNEAGGQRRPDKRRRRPKPKGEGKPNDKPGPKANE